MMCKIVQRVSRVLVVRMRTFGLRAVERRVRGGAALQRDRFPQTM